MKTKAATPLTNSENAKKRVKNNLESMQSLMAEMQKLEMQKNALREAIEREMNEKAQNLLSSETTRALLLVKSYSSDRWSCVICAADFKPMFLCNPDARDSDYLYHCEKCGISSCFKCTVRMLKCNPICSDSIGFSCVQCKFFNCNHSARHTKFDSIEEYPFPSGYTTLEQSKVKGEKLMTSNATMSNEKHEENLSIQKENYNLRRDVLPGPAEIIPRYRPVRVSYSPRSPVYRTSDSPTEIIDL
jgi:hypothetical protein